jgi:thiamine pyrophosphate-dependent acetolactate synthase large subunit-like protein
MNTAEVLIQMLLDARVSHVYGVSGDSLNAFTNAILADSGNREEFARANYSILPSGQSRDRFVIWQ